MNILENFIQAFKDCYSNKFNEFFCGRSKRSEYWYFVLVHVIIGMIIGVAQASVLIGVSEDAGNLISTLYGLAAFLPALGMSVRRLRDAGFHWAWEFIAFVPLVGWIALIIFHCLPSKQTVDVSDGSNGENIDEAVVVSE